MNVETTAIYQGVDAKLLENVGRRITSGDRRKRKRGYRILSSIAPFLVSVESKPSGSEGMIKVKKVGVR